ncbi:MAG TPA: porin [Pirellulales bacterium]|jgi:phosphate-selective porin OprO/OprP|nr:porin [Pirellulales bacterium]
MYRSRARLFGLLACSLANWHGLAIGQSLIPSAATTLAADADQGAAPGPDVFQFKIFAAGAPWQPVGSPGVALPSATLFSASPIDFEQTADAQTADAEPASLDPAKTNMGTVTPPENLPPSTEPQERPVIPDRDANFGTIRLPEGYPRNLPKDAKAKDRKVEAEFGDGLTVKSSDGYFSLTFHNLTQADGRFFQPTGNPLTDNFLVPRQRWYVLGNVSPNIRYYTVINRGYGSIDLLDAFIDMNFGAVDPEKLQIRVGRMKTPYTYEYIKISETDLVAPERSVFVGNLAGNRQMGAMAHGDLLEKRFEYALGIFDGPRRSFQDYNAAKDFFSYINIKPFRKWECSPLQQLNVGGSFNCGDELNPLQPTTLRTANDQTPSAEANSVSPSFLQFGPNVFEDGWRMQWSGDLTWYYKSFMLMTGYQGGFQTYGNSATALNSGFTNATSATQTRVPLSGWNITTSYFLTGEQVTRRVFLVEPRSEFRSVRKRGTGAIELFSRFANIHLGNAVFTNGIVNQAAWSNNANVTDIGVNWYPNHYTKLTFDWQYSDFGKPVQWGANQMSSFCNLYWLRAQIFF